MTERIKITVRASASHSGVLTVPDAMRQVLDIFELLSSPEGGGKVIWALISATTNSPLTIEGEAIGRAPGVDVAPAARAQKAALTRNLRQLRRGMVPREWTQHDRLRTVRRLMSRTVDGVGDTDISVSDTGPPVVITPIEANAGLRILDRVTASYELLDEDRSRDEYGAIEGTLLLAGFEYNQPAIKIEERRSRQEVWCRVTEEERDRIAQTTNFRDVWDHRRVAVRGRIRYGQNGEIVRVYATSVERVEPKAVPVEKLRDPMFTGGLSVSQYLERLREGEVGL